MQPTYRVLPLEEFDKAKPLFDKLFPGLRYPTPQVAKVGVAEVDDKVVGFWFIQLCAHTEPAGVDPDYATEVSLHKLFETLQLDLINNNSVGMEYYVYTATPEWDQALRSVGFTPVGFAYSGRVPEEV